MAQTSILSSISRTGTFPIRKTINAPNNCGTISLVLNQNWTEQMIHELPTINVAVYIDTDIKLLSIDIDMSTVTSDNIELKPVTSYSIPLFDLPTDFDFVVTPIFDEDALLSHNLQIDSGDIDVFNTSDNGIVDTNIGSYINEYWTTKTDTFNLNMVFDNSNIASGGSGGGGGGGQITVDTQVMQGSTNPVQNGAIYDFVNSSVSTNTAYFIGTFNSLSDLENYSGEVSNNDYAFVVSVDSNSNTIYNRYKYNSETETWNFEYSLNNSSFTAAEWETIQSGLTANDRTNYNNHLADTNNPHSVTKTQVGLGNVDNTSDANKPISTATQTALNAKQNTLTFDGTYDASTNKAATVSTVTNAINDLDVSSVGGSGKYISAISETNGKISPTVETMDTVPTSGSTKAVTSGGVQAPLAEVVDNGAKNCATVNNATYTNVPRYIVIDSICDKNCVLSLDSITSTDTNASTCALLFKFEDDTLSSTIIQLPRGTRYEREFSFEKNVKSLQIYASNNYNNSGTTNTVTITNLMLCTKAEWDISHEYVPYGKTNAELTVAEDEDRAALAEVIDGGAAGTKNRLVFDCIGNGGSTWGSSYTHNGITYTVLGNGTVSAYGTCDTDNNSFGYLGLSNSKVNIDALCDGTHMLSGCPSGGSTSTWRIYVTKSGYGNYSETGAGTLLPDRASNTGILICCFVSKGTTISQNSPIIFKPMLCRKTLYDVNPDYEPYAPAKTNVEITPALVEVVDAGAKNVLDVTRQTTTVSGLTFTVNSDKSITVSGTAGTNNVAFNLYTGSNYIANDFSGMIVSDGSPESNSDVYLYYAVSNNGSSASAEYSLYGNTSKVIGTFPYVRFAVLVKANTSIINPITIKPMICTKPKWNISHKFVPYALPNPTLTPALIEQVDNGAKNHLYCDMSIMKSANTNGTWRGNSFTHNSGVTFTINSDSSITVNGTASGVNGVFVLSTDFTISQGDWILSGTPTGGSSSTYNTTIAGVISDVGNTPHFSSATNKLVRIYVLAGTTANNLLFKPMICSADDWAISQAYVPYGKTNPELTVENESQQSEINYAVNTGVKNLLKIDTSQIKSSSWNFDWTWSGNTASNGNASITINQDNTFTVAVSNTMEEQVIFDIYFSNDNVSNIILSGCPSGGSNSTHFMYVKGTSYYDTGNGVTFSKTGPFRIAIVVVSGHAAGTYVFKPMLRAAAITDSTFQPYALPNPTLTPAVIKAVDEGAKNFLTENTKTETGQWTNIPVVLQAGSYVLAIGTLSSTDTDATTCQIGLFNSANQNLLGSYPQLNRGNNIVYSFEITSESSYLRVYSSNTTAHGAGDTVTVTNAMICTTADWAVSQKFVPYRLPYQQISDAVLNKTPVVYGFHVNPNESDPSAAVTYLLDAVGMAPAKMGSSTFSYGSWKNAFFIPKPCMLKSDGTVDYYLNPNDYTQKSDGTASDVANASYDGNAMMEWPKIWFKYVPGDVDGEWEFYVSNQNVDGTYKCWCNINAAGQEIDHFYTAIYNGTGTTKLRSISGVQLTTANGADNTTRQQEIDRALANNTGTNVMWYTEVWSDRLLINALLYLIGKSLNLQSTFGQGMTSGSQTAKQNYYTGGKLDSNSTFNLNNKGLFWGDITNTTNPVKVFGMENLWGCVYRSCAGLLAVDNALKVKLTYDVQDGSTAHGYNLTGNGYLSFGTSASSGYVTKMKADTDKGYIPSSAGETGAGASTYYCDYYNVNTSGTRHALLGGASVSGAYCGFFVGLSNVVSDSVWRVSAALSCKPQS